LKSILVIVEPCWLHTVLQFQFKVHVAVQLLCFESLIHVFECLFIATRSKIFWKQYCFYQLMAIWPKLAWNALIALMTIWFEFISFSESFSL